MTAPWLYRLSSFWVLPLVAWYAACPKDVAPEAPAGAAVAAVPAYAFDRPDARFVLPKRLKEISGLTVLDDRHLGAIQDEDGVFFVIETATGDVVEERSFGKDRDYEGIERAGDALFILRSDGTLYEIEDWEEKHPDKVDKLDTRLKARNDTEGLAYDAAGRRLLIACKEHAGKGLAHHKAIYAYDLERKELLPEPAYVIDLRAVAEQLRGGEHPLNAGIRKLVGRAADLSGFKPSGLALHPKTGQLYVLSSVRKAILVLNPDGAVADVYALPDDRFAQPEGITFLPSGDLFIANEAAGGEATLLRFNRQAP